jgi:lipopolysaccharide transport protein LptA
MKKYGWIAVLVILGLLGIVFRVCLAKSDQEPVRITAAMVSGDAEKKITYLEGNVRITQGKTTITTEYVTVDLDRKTARLERGTRLVNLDVTIDSRRLDYNLKQKTGTFREQVLLERIESESVEKTKKDPFTLATAELYFESDTKNFKASEDCRLKHKKFEGKANRIEYDDAGQKLTFNEKVEIKQDATEIRSESATIDMSGKLLQISTKTDVTSREIKISADSLRYNYEQKTGNFPTEVLLTRSEVKNSKGKVTKEPFTLKAAGLYFETETNNFMAEDGRIEHQDFTGTADTIEYDDKRQSLTFKGNARLTRTQGEELTGVLIEINLDDRSFTVHQKGTVILKIQEEK